MKGRIFVSCVDMVFDIEGSLDYRLVHVRLDYVDCLNCIRPSFFYICIFLAKQPQ